MKKNTQYVYVLTVDFNSEEENDDFCRVFTDPDKALKAYRDFVANEKQSDFVLNNTGDSEFDTFADFESLDEDPFLCLYNFGSYDGSYYTKVVLRKAEIE